LYWRVNQFFLPFWILVPPQSKFPELSEHAWVPIDDEHKLCLMFSFTPQEEFCPKCRVILEEGFKGRETEHASRSCYEDKPASTPYADFCAKFNPENGYHFNYAAQESTYFSGLPGLWVQDAACQSDVMPIYDLTMENLCVSDADVASTRHLLLGVLYDYHNKVEPPLGVLQPDKFMALAVSVMLPSDSDWLTACTPYMKAQLGADFGNTP